MMLYKICIIATILCALFAYNCANPAAARCTYTLEIGQDYAEFNNENGINEIVVNESDGFLYLLFEIHKSDPMCNFRDNVTFTVSPQDGTATNEDDYTASNDTFILSASQLQYNYTVTILDNENDSDQLFLNFSIYYSYVSVFGTDYMEDDPGYMIIYIEDDEDPTPSSTAFGITYPGCAFILSIGDGYHVYINEANEKMISIPEDIGIFNLTFTINKSDPRCVFSDNVTIVTTTIDGTASSTFDYISTSPETFILSQSQLTYNYEVGIVNNVLTEVVEYFKIGYTVSSALSIDYLDEDDPEEMIIYIEDDDAYGGEPRS